MQHILWRDDQPPSFVPWLESVRDVARLRLPNPTDNMGGRKLSYIEEVQFLINKFHVWLEGEPILLRVGPGWQEGPFTAALHMAGDQVFDWAEQEPNALHDLLAIITEASIDYERTVRQLVEADMAGACIRSSGTEALSEELYREFVLPYSLQIYEAFPGPRRLHMWGDINHLLELLLDEQGITHLDGCGSKVDTQHLVDTMGGKVVVRGKLDPDVLLNGTTEEVTQAAWEVLEAFLEVGGLVLSNGDEIHPNTPVENLNALVIAAEEFAERYQ
jgi:uroporphyrinogen-III decarboxylase